MSRPTSWLCRGAFALLAAACMSALLPGARADIIDDFKKEKQIAAQQVEQQVKEAIVDAQHLKAKEPEKALFILKSLKHTVEIDPNLSKDRRDVLLSLVGEQLKAMEATAPPAKGDKGDPPPKQKTKQELELEQLYGSGGNSGKPLPGSPGGIADKYIKDVKGKIQTDKDIKGKTDKASLALLNPDIGDIPGDSGVSLGKDFKSIMAKRKQSNANKLSEEEQAIVKAMNSTIKLDIVKQPFQSVLDYLHDKTGLAIAVDPNALKALEIDSSTTTVTLQADKISTRVALKKILGDVGLAYIIKGGIVQVVTPQVAQNTMTTQSYFIGDLIPPGPVGSYGYNLAREQYFANQIMQTLVMTVEPQSWAINGNGQGTIWYNAATKSIVVRNSAELHLSLKSSFAGGNH